jgi:hypothetical protein
VIKVALLSLIAVGTVQCHGKQIPISEACAIGKATLYSDGNFSFDKEESAAIKQRNAVKIAAYKRWYKKNC